MKRFLAQNDEISIKQTNTEKTIISEDEKKPKRHARKKNDGESAKTVSHRIQDKKKNQYFQYFIDK